MKNVQIPYDLFVALVEYHLACDDDYAEEIRFFVNRNRSVPRSCFCVRRKEGRPVSQTRKRSQNAQPQNEILCSMGFGAAAPTSNFRKWSLGRN